MTDAEYIEVLYQALSDLLDSLVDDHQDCVICGAPALTKHSSGSSCGRAENAITNFVKSAAGWRGKR